MTKAQRLIFDEFKFADQNLKNAVVLKKFLSDECKFSDTDIKDFSRSNSIYYRDAFLGTLFWIIIFFIAFGWSDVFILWESSHRVVAVLTAMLSPMFITIIFYGVYFYTALFFKKPHPLLQFYEIEKARLSSPKVSVEDIITGKKRFSKKSFFEQELNSYKSKYINKISNSPGD